MFAFTGGLNSRNYGNNERFQQKKNTYQMKLSYAIDRGLFFGNFFTFISPKLHLQNGML